MLTIAQEIYPKEYDQLIAIISAIQDQDLTSANRLLAKAEQSLAAIDALPQRLQMELFMKAIRSRLDHSQAENLYLVPDEGQQIRMFNFMAEKFPVVRAAQSIANTAFLAQISSETAFSILDIGIGTGQQMATLIQKVISQYPHVKDISVIGIEPSGDSLAKSEARFKELAIEYGIRLSFLGIEKTMEQLDSADWKLLETQIQSVKGKFLINASFALHHVHPVAFRTELFHRLKALNPAAFVIIEPYANYLSNDLAIRFQNAWHHYGLTFRAIDTINADEEEKCAVKQVFFGREMLDVLSEGERVEEFETAEMWSERLKQAGFSISRSNNVPIQEFNSIIQIDDRQSYVGFNVSGHPIVAVISAS